MLNKHPLTVPAIHIPIILLVCFMPIRCRIIALHFSCMLNKHPLTVPAIHIPMIMLICFMPASLCVILSRIVLAAAKPCFHACTVQNRAPVLERANHCCISLTNLSLLPPSCRNSACLSLFTSVSRSCLLPSTSNSKPSRFAMHSSPFLITSCFCMAKSASSSANSRFAFSCSVSCILNSLASDRTSSSSPLTPSSSAYFLRSSSN